MQNQRGIDWGELIWRGLDWLGWSLILAGAIVLALLSASGCAIQHKAPVLYNADNDPLRVCASKPTLTYWIEYNPAVSDDALRAVVLAAEYWNSLTDRPVFRLGESMASDVLIYIDGHRPSSAHPTAIGHATDYSPWGCIVLATVWLSALETGNVDFFESIIRHELGHVLGLDHRSGVFCPDLMCDKIEPSWSGMHPLDVDGEHLNTLRELYPERTWAKGAGRWEL